MRSKKFFKNIEYDDVFIPVHIYKEMRMDVRIAILKDKAILRLPIYYSKKQFDKNFTWAENWIKNNLNKNVQLKHRFILKEYNSNQRLQINGKEFLLEIKEEERNNYNAKLVKDTIYIYVPPKANVYEKQKAFKTLQSRVIGRYFLPEITQRISKLNEKHFGVEINTIKLKYNKSNWGSRSAKNNINISTRLLFAPKEVQDYVFIHELAHFKEMNHSSKFWDIVKKIDPNYKEKEKWLKENGQFCDF